MLPPLTFLVDLTMNLMSRLHLNMRWKIAIFSYSDNN